MRPLLEAYREIADEGDERSADKVRRALEAIGTAATDAMVAALDDAPAGFRWYLVRLLGRIGSAEAIPALTALLEDGDPAIAGEAEYALEQVQGRDGLTTSQVAVAEGTDPDDKEAWQ